MGPQCRFQSVYFFSFHPFSLYTPIRNVRCQYIKHNSLMTGKPEVLKRILNVGFLWRERNRSSWRKHKNQKQTRSTYDADSGIRTRDTLEGGERSRLRAKLELTFFLGLGGKVLSGNEGVLSAYLLILP